jgi:predicted phosphohydrolase
MSVFAMSDTHLSFANNKPMSIFGDRWKDHETKIRQGWEAADIKDDDYIIIPGDISWALKLEDSYLDFAFLESLKGIKIIGKGNHDLWWSTDRKVMEMFDGQGFKTMKLLKNNCVVTDDYIICGSRGWYIDEKNAPTDSDYNKIVRREVLRLEMSISEGVKNNPDNKEILLFLHFPPVFKDFRCREIIEVIKKYDIKRCYYGHIHSVYDIPSYIEYDGIDFIIISADYLNFKPFKITCDKS